MADKEEIIFILTRTNSIKDGIRTETHKDNAMTRQEAIEVMAKGMYLLTNPEDTKYANFYNCYFFELAEAALNALLEGGK